MNLEDSKTLEDYREAAHYWQKQWQLVDAENFKLKNEIERLSRRTASELKNELARHGICDASEGVFVQGGSSPTYRTVETHTRKWSGWFPSLRRLFQIGFRKS